MGIKSSGFARKSETSDEIPSSSLADIAFLLLIFFMVTTVFRTDSERPIEWAQAEATEKIDEKAKNILNVWVDQDGSIWMNDRPFAMADVGAFVRPLYAASEQHLVISIRSDREVPYRYIDQLQEQMVAAGVVRVVFATELERSMTRERR
jgi:biopolymer transport protein ExbD